MAGVDGGRSWTVAALLLAASDALQARLGAVTVRGELSGFARAGSGHCYFSLKDSDGQAALLRCAMFRRAATLLDFTPADGQQVELRGRIAVYEARGELQCVVEAMRPLGAGSLYELFLRLKAKLEAAGLFDATRRRTIAAHPRAVGVITSLGAAALHDVVTAIRRRAPHVPVVIYPSSVQGVEAPGQLVQALQRAAQRTEVDTLIVCRGGGSIEDLWAFNDEQVVRAIAASPLPVICGIGHETDLTLAELAADLRAPTPTAAAELATPMQSDELVRLSLLAGHLQRAVRRRWEGLAQGLDRLALHLDRPARRLAEAQSRLAQMAFRLRLAVAHALRQRRQGWNDLHQRRRMAAPRPLAGQHEVLERLALRLAAVDPHQVLSRGYAWLSQPGGAPVTSASGVLPGQRLEAQWSDGRAEMEVLRVLAGPPER